jgi:hypothetical protein
MWKGFKTAAAAAAARGNTGGRIIRTRILPADKSEFLPERFDKTSHPLSRTFSTINS